MTRKNKKNKEKQNPNKGTFNVVNMHCRFLLQLFNYRVEEQTGETQFHNLQLKPFFSTRRERRKKKKIIKKKITNKTGKKHFGAFKTRGGAIFSITLEDNQV